ncbi:MAG TPA: hypothetical protein VEW26_08125 [Allosphingosinicella sp.]|nr:hypothetical protein [Allosphingosinicella sp.]
MRELESWLTGLLLAAVALLLPMAALEPVSRAGATAVAAGLAAGACDDGSAHLAMGCASILL